MCHRCLPDQSLEQGTMTSTNLFCATICRALLQITAMRYACISHDDLVCTEDTLNWCSYDETISSCQLRYDDADFIGMLLWSATSIACKGSKMSEIVACSYYVSQVDCTTNSCEWSEQACYPPWYAGMVTMPKMLEKFKTQVGGGDLNRVPPYGGSGWDAAGAQHPPAPVW